MAEPELWRYGRAPSFGWPASFVGVRDCFSTSNARSERIPFATMTLRSLQPMSHR